MNWYHFQTILHFKFLVKKRNKKRSNKSNSTQTQRQRRKRKLLKLKNDIIDVDIGEKNVFDPTISDIEYQNDECRKVKEKLLKMAKSEDELAKSKPKSDHHTPDFSKLPKSPSGHSKWYPGNKRPIWSRPCFQQYKYVVLADSQCKIWGQKNICQPDYSITSFSGCDVSFQVNNGVSKLIIVFPS